MLRAVMTQPGAIQVHDVEQLVTKAQEVLVNIKKIGVYGSDIHVYHGLHPYTGYPVVQGHEVAGEIVEFGQDITESRIANSA
ncbi:hypothetical protein CSA56_10870 [candidate division KSB3 bacterium]|uniref:Alcohol dehydrogenase-like N-terminal domain-containing protein n=1 Tax=candidate division KSB3 bacterium TaxID=2044937 RepID=A0A2G6KE00_9BACT|nr:MAG: hypothetical protein CSA56_10870 [candidate division KSB3 bacterium]